MSLLFNREISELRIYIRDLKSELVAARAEGEEQARLLGMSGSREAKHLAEIQRLEHAVMDWNVVIEDLRSENKRLLVALEEYGSCTDDCACCPQTAGRPTKDGGYETQIHGNWYRTRPVDERPKCNCGFQTALDGGKP